MTDRYYFFLSLLSVPCIYLYANISPTFGKLRPNVHRGGGDGRGRMPGIFHAGRVHVHAEEGEEEVGRGSVITASLMDGRRRPRIRNTGVSFVSVWGISAIFPANDNCRGDGIPSRKKSRVTSYTISWGATCIKPDDIAARKQRNSVSRMTDSFLYYFHGEITSSRIFQSCCTDTYS